MASIFCTHISSFWMLTNKTAWPLEWKHFTTLLQSLTPEKSKNCPEFASFRYLFWNFLPYKLSCLVGCLVHYASCHFWKAEYKITSEGVHKILLLLTTSVFPVSFDLLQIRYSGPRSGSNCYLMLVLENFMVRTGGHKAYHTIWMHYRVANMDALMCLAFRRRVGTRALPKTWGPTLSMSPVPVCTCQLCSLCQNIRPSALWCSHFTLWVPVLLLTPTHSLLNLFTLAGYVSISDMVWHYFNVHIVQHVTPY